MEPICWTPWVGEKVEDKTVFLSRIKRGFSEKEVTDYFKQYFRIRKSENEVREATAVKNQRALVHFRNSIGILISRTDFTQHASLAVISKR